MPAVHLADQATEGLAGIWAYIAADNPLAACDYVVNGKPAIDWVMEHQAVTTDKASGIVNEANLWATESMNNAAYPLELLLRVITVSLETMNIVKNFPGLDIAEPASEDSAQQSEELL